MISVNIKYKVFQLSNYLGLHEGISDAQCKNRK